MAFVAVAEGEGEFVAAEVVVAASVAKVVGTGDPWAEPAGVDVPAAVDAPAGVSAGEAHAATAIAATIIAAAIPANARLFRARTPIEDRMGPSMRDNGVEMRSDRKLSLRSLWISGCRAYSAALAARPPALAWRPDRAACSAWKWARSGFSLSARMATKEITAAPTPTQTEFAIAIEKA